MTVAPLAVLALVASLDVGANAPDFSLPTPSAKEPVALQSEIAKHKLTVVMFVSTTCPVSNAYNERMKQLATDYAQKGVAFVGVDANKSESMDDIAKFTKEKAFPFSWVKDEGNKVADAYNAHVTPEIFIIDAQGKVRYHGRIDEKQDGVDIKSPDLKNALDALLAGKAPSHTETKAFGCSIKRV